MRGSELGLVCQFAVLALLLGSGDLAVGQTPVEISQPEVSTHRISRVDFIRTPGAAPPQALELRVEVDKNGAVTSVRVAYGPEESHEAAVALAKTWRYKPFERDGQTVLATFTDFVSILPPERAVTGRVPFPVAHDWATVKITLNRTPGFGPGAPYEVQIDGNGDVLLKGVAGERRLQISREALERLLDVFRKAKYFSLDREYRLGAEDLPTCITSISIGGQSMSVTDYGGLQVGMPASVRDVEEAIDEAAGTRDWLKPSR